MAWWEAGDKTENIFEQEETVVEPLGLCMPNIVERKGQTALEL